MSSKRIKNLLFLSLLVQYCLQADCHKMHSEESASLTVVGKTSGVRSERYSLITRTHTTCCG